MPADGQPDTFVRTAPALRGWLPTALRLAALAALVGAAIWAGERVAALLPGLMPGGAAGVTALIAVSLAVYVICLALPFVPGVEIAVGLLAMFGAAVAPAVWAATVLALALSFMAGRLVPLSAVVALCRRLGLRRAEAMLAAMAGQDAAGRLAVLMGGGGRAMPFLVRNRYLALAVLLNTPGNAVLGGGGGIALLAGISGVFSVPGYLAAVALAAAPVPVLVWATGSLF